jgi:hypothetical protein
MRTPRKFWLMPSLEFLKLRAEMPPSDSGPGIDPDISNAFSMLSTPRSPAEWGWGSRSAGPSLTPVGAGCGQTQTSLEARSISVHLAELGKELMNSLRAAHQTEEPHEDMARNASHQRACGGNKRSQRSGRGPATGGLRHRSGDGSSALASVRELASD